MILEVQPLEIKNFDLGHPVVVFHAYFKVLHVTHVLKVPRIMPNVTVKL